MKTTRPVSNPSRLWPCAFFQNALATLSFLWLITGLSSLQAATNTEILVNPGFENGTTPWIGAYWGGSSDNVNGTITDPTHSGNWMRYLHGLAGPRTVVEEGIGAGNGTLPIPQGATVHTSVWVRCPDATVENPCQARLRLRVNGSGAGLGPVALNLTTSDWTLLDDGTAGAGWTYPVGSDWLAWRVYGPDGVDRNLYLDDGTCKVDWTAIKGTISLSDAADPTGTTLKLEDASLNVLYTTTVDNSGGTYAWPVADGTYTVVASKSGYAPNSALVTVSGGSVAGPDFTVNLTLTKSLYGTATGFAGYYPPVNWDPIYTFSDATGVGSAAHVVTTEAPDAITLWAQQGNMWSGATSLYLIPVPASGTVTFDWLYTAGNSGNSCAGYAVNPALTTWGADSQWTNPGGHPGCTNLAGRYSSDTSNNTTGHVSIAVNAGDMIGFWVHNAFYNDPANIRISNFTAPDGAFHNITSSVGTGGGGTITPLGTVIAPDGLNRSFTITPPLYGYYSDVLVDTVSVGARTSYTFSNVTGNHTIEADYLALPMFSGVVSGPSGPIYSAKVTLSDGSSVRTNAAGVYFIVPPADGSYTLTASKGGYVTSAAQPATMSGATVENLDFTLVKSSGLDPLVVLDASTLTADTELTEWTNTGTLGGSFVKGLTITGPPVVANIAGKQAVDFSAQLTSNGGTGDRRTLVSSFLTPSEMAGKSDWTVSTVIYKANMGSWDGENAYLSRAGFNNGGGKSDEICYASNKAIDHNGSGWGFATVPSGGAWHQVTITYDGTTETIYVDGVRDEYRTIALDIATGDPILVGSTSNNTGAGRQGDDWYWRFNGAISKLQIFDQALTQAEVEVLNGFASRTISGIVSADSVPVEGVSVTLKQGSTVVAGPYTTGVDGYYELSAILPVDATRTVTAIKGGSLGTRDVLITTATTYPGQDITLAAAPPQGMFVSHTTINRNGGYSLGTQFRTGTNYVSVSKLGYVDEGSNGLSVSHQVAIYDASNNQIAYGLVPANNDGELINEFRYVAITPVTLLPNTIYTLMASEVGDNSTNEATNPGFSSPYFDGFVALGAWATDPDSTSNVRPPGWLWGNGHVYTGVNMIGITVPPPPERTVSGTIRDAGGTVNGASVTLKKGTSIVAGPYTTGVDGIYTLTASFTDGDTCAVSASKPGDLPGSLDVPITTATTYTGKDILLATDVSYDPNLIFSMTVDGLAGKSTGDSTGDRATLFPTGGTMAMWGSPTVVPVDGVAGVNWEQNVYNDNDGYLFKDPVNAPDGVWNAPIPATGVSIVAVVQPNYFTTTVGEPRGEIVDVFYNELFLAVSHRDYNEGNVIVNFKDYATYDTGYNIPNGQKTVLSFVVQQTGEAKLYVNGEQVWSVSSGKDYSSLIPLSWYKQISVGRGTDGWSTFTGNIGNVYLYKTAVSDGNRVALEQSLGTKFGITMAGGFTVAYDSNGGTGVQTDSTSYPSNATVTVKDQGTMAKSGYTFSGWNTLANGTGTAYSPAATFNILANTTLYAQWTLQTPFQQWVGPFFGGSTNPLIVGRAADPDGDGQNNLLEFALGGTPNNGALNAKVYSFNAVSTEFGSTNKVLVLTIAVRTATPTFSGSPAVAVHPTDGVKYTVQGGLDMTSWTGTIYSCVDAILPAGVTPESAGAGYEYRSFILQSSDGLPGKGFLQVKIEPNP